MTWLVLTHDPVTIISELGFPVVIALLVFYLMRDMVKGQDRSLTKITDQFTQFLMKQNEVQGESLSTIHEAMTIQNQSLREVKESMSEMTQFLKGLNGKLRGGS